MLLVSPTFPGKGGKAVKEENEKVKAGQKKQEAEKKEADNWRDGAKASRVEPPLPAAPAARLVPLLVVGLTPDRNRCFYAPQVKDTSKEEKRQAELARKAELARLLAEVRRPDARRADPDLAS